MRVYVLGLEVQMVQGLKEECLGFNVSLYAFDVCFVY